jgi:hypothetical protein
MFEVKILPRTTVVKLQIAIWWDNEIITCMFSQVKTGDGQKLKSDLRTKDGHSSKSALNWPEIMNSIYSTNEISMYLTD